MKTCEPRAFFSERSSMVPSGNKADNESKNIFELPTESLSESQLNLRIVSSVLSLTFSHTGKVSHERLVTCKIKIIDYKDSCCSAI